MIGRLSGNARTGVFSSWRTTSTPFSVTITRLTPRPPATMPASPIDSWSTRTRSVGDEMRTSNGGAAAATTGVGFASCFAGSAFTGSGFTASGFAASGFAGSGLGGSAFATAGGATGAGSGFTGSGLGDSGLARPGRRSGLTGPGRPASGGSCLNGRGLSPAPSGPGRGPACGTGPAGGVGPGMGPRSGPGVATDATAGS